MMYFKPDGECNEIKYKGDKVLKMADNWVIKELWVYEYDTDTPMIKLAVEPKKKTTVKIIEE